MPRRADRPTTYVGAPTSFIEIPDVAEQRGARVRLATAAEGARVRLAVGDPALVFALAGSARLEREDWILDAATWFVMPAKTRASLRVISPTARVLAIEIDAARRAEMVRQYTPEGVKADALTSVLASPRRLPRTTWVHELAHRYAFERAVCRKHGSPPARFIEIELAKEAYFLTMEASAERPRASRYEGHGELVTRAIAIVDASLARPLAIAELARRAGTSRRTLIRAFERELSVSPRAYLRGRRLDEARVLLRSGRYSVAEVAERVGYGNASAFSTAYASRFGRPPSAELGG
jgi:AraC-like DNA-binding protein